MSIETHPLSGIRRRGRTPEAIVADQKAQAAKEKTQKAKAAVPAKAAPTNTPVKPAAAVAIPDNRTEVQKYLDEIAPAGIAGRLIKFTKEGVFATADDGEPVPEAADFIALCDETLVGWIKFNRDKDSDTPPERVMGLLYDGFVMPPRNTLGDTDVTQWEPGLSGAPEDPWHHQVCLVLQNTETKELYTFATTSQTGRRAVGNLLKHFDRMRRTNSADAGRAAQKRRLQSSRRPHWLGQCASVRRRRPRAARQRGKTGYLCGRRSQRPNPVSLGDQALSAYPFRQP